MDDKKMIKIKKSAGTLTGLVVTLLLVIGVFTGLFLWLGANADDAGITVDSKYNDTYNNLTTSFNEIEDDIDDIGISLNDIQEADSTWQVAWNGMKGIGKTLLLPISMIGHANDVTETTLGSTDIIPPWAKTLILAGILAFIVFLLLRVLTGGNPAL